MLGTPGKDITDMFCQLGESELVEGLIEVKQKMEGAGIKAIVNLVGGTYIAGLGTLLGYAFLIAPSREWRWDIESAVRFFLSGIAVGGLGSGLAILWYGTREIAKYQSLKEKKETLVQQLEQYREEGTLK